MYVLFSGSAHRLQAAAAAHAQAQLHAQATTQIIVFEHSVSITRMFIGTCGCSRGSCCSKAASSTALTGSGGFFEPSIVICRIKLLRDAQDCTGDVPNGDADSVLLQQVSSLQV